MTQMKERAVNIVQRLPDDKTISQLAYQDLQKYRKEGVQEINDKEELAQALEEKFDGLERNVGQPCQKYSDVYLSELKNEGLGVLYGSGCQQEVAYIDQSIVQQF